jgi:hypothetical protein
MVRGEKEDLTLSTTKVGRFSVCCPEGLILPSSGLYQGAPAMDIYIAHSPL